MDGIIVSTKVKAIPGDEVWVSNYRAGGRWEVGEVMFTTIGVDKNGNGKPQYRVVLERRSAKGNYIFVTVGDQDIQQIKTIQQ